MNGLLGKRFVFGIVSVCCITITACYLRYDGEIYLKLVGTIAALFIAGQTITDVKEAAKGGELNAVNKSNH